MLNGDMDGHVTLKAGEAPEKVYHPLTADARLKALAFTRLRTSKFVRDIISAGLLPITSDLTKFEIHLAGMFAKQRTSKQLEELCGVRILVSKLPTLSKYMLDGQRAALEASGTSTDAAQACAEPNEGAVDTHRVDIAQTNPQAQWQHAELPSAPLAARIQEFEASAEDPDPHRRGFKLAVGQRASCKWFGHVLDAAVDEEIRQVPVHERKQSACVLRGADGTGKTAIILELLLPTFLESFQAQDGEYRYAILIFQCTRRCDFERDIPSPNRTRCCWLQSC